jgi:3-hydroxyisobutyrate dehydrogenase
MRVGFVGVGRLGRHLAMQILRAGAEAERCPPSGRPAKRAGPGFTLTVHDRNPAGAADLVAAGASWADTPRELAERSDTVITCLPSPAAVTAVLTGENGILAGLPAGATWIDTSTNDRHELLRLAALAAEQGVVTLEAPVTGGVHKAAAGEITVLVGGDEGAFRSHLPLFEAIGGEVFHIGPLGNASVIKVITNMLAFVHVVALGEALMLARRGGLNLGQAYEAIRASSGNSFVHETESRLILNGSYDIGFTMDLALKDLGFARELGREFGVPLELATLVEETFVRGREAYGGAAWSTMVVKLLEDELGTDLRAPGFAATLE